MMTPAFLLWLAVLMTQQAPPPATPLPPLPPPTLLAEDVYANVEIFKGKPAITLLPTMLAIRSSLGVECSYCHTPHDWAAEDKPQKERARQMLHMLADLNTSSFPGPGKVSCWACHRGHSKPETLPPDPDAAARVARLISIPAGDEKKPAEQVFKNIQTLKGVSADRFPAIMTMFSRALGVRCNHCHNPDDFAADTEKKKTARQMLALVGQTTRKYWDGNGPLACYTCHHGALKPEVQATALAPPPATPPQ